MLRKRDIECRLRRRKEVTILWMEWKIKQKIIGVEDKCHILPMQTGYKWREITKRKCLKKYHAIDTKEELRTKPFLERFISPLNAAWHISQEENKTNNYLNIEEIAKLTGKSLIYFNQCTSNHWLSTNLILLKRWKPLIVSQSWKRIQQIAGLI